MKHMDITLALLINAMAIFVLAAAVTSVGPSDPEQPAPVLSRTALDDPQTPVAPTGEPTGRVKQ